MVLQSKDGGLTITLTDRAWGNDWNTRKHGSKNNHIVLNEKTLDKFYELKKEITK